VLSAFEGRSHCPNMPLIAKWTSGDGLMHLPDSTNITVRNGHRASLVGLVGGCFETMQLPIEAERPFRLRTMSKVRHLAVINEVFAGKCFSE